MAARSLGIRPQLLDAQQIEGAFDAASAQNADALIEVVDIVTEASRRLIVELVASYRLPAMNFWQGVRRC